MLPRPHSTLWCPPHTKWHVIPNIMACIDLLLLVFLLFLETINHCIGSKMMRLWQQAVWCSAREEEKMWWRQHMAMSNTAWCQCTHHPDAARGGGDATLQHVLMTHNVGQGAALSCMFWSENVLKNDQNQSRTQNSARILAEHEWSDCSACSAEGTESEHHFSDKCTVNDSWTSCLHK